MTATTQVERGQGLHGEARRDLGRAAETRGQPLAWLWGAAVLAALVAWFGLQPLRDTLDLYALAERANPYWVPDHALLVYVVTPLTALATSVFFLVPGLALAAAYGRRKSVAAWLIWALALSILAHVGVTTVFQLATGIVAKGAAFYVLVAATGLGALLVSLPGARAGWKVDRDGADRTDIWLGLAAFWLFLALLAPKFYWENFTGDGSGSLQFARSFIHTLWPFWQPEAGTIAKAPGLTSFLFVPPESWFVRLWGETEFSVRVPYLGYLAIVIPVLLGLIRWGRDRVPGGFDRGLILAALFVYTMAVIYSGGYNPYFGDSPMPAARETLALIGFLGYILAFLEDRRALMMTAGIMAHLTIPTGGLWLLLWPLAVLLVWRPIPWERLRFAALVLGVAAAISVLVPMLITAVGLPIPGGEFNAKAIVNRLRYVSLADWNRFAFLIVPCGIVPVAALALWRRQDAAARAMTLVTLVFFFFFYFQGYRVLLHHFIPVMLLPLVVFWRAGLTQGAGGLAWRGAAAVGIVSALWLAWPREMRMHTFDRTIGQHIQTLGPRFASAEPAEGDRFRGFEPRALDTAHELLGRLFPIGYTDDEPRNRFFGAPLVWWFYSEFPKPEGQVVNYTIRPLDTATAEDGTLFADYDGYGLYIRDQALYEAQSATRLPTDTGAAIFVTSRDIIFGKGARWGDRVVIDLVGIGKAVVGGN